MRQRIFTNVSHIGLIEHYRKSSRSSPWGPDSPASASQQFGHYDAMTDEVTPNFHKRRASGEVIINEMVHKVSSQDGMGGSLVMENVDPSSSSFKHVGTTGSLSAYYAAILNIPNAQDPLYAPSLPEVFDQVRFSALASVDRPPAALMEDLLEFRKTARLLRHPLHEVINTASQMKRALNARGVGGKVSKLSDASADAWLKGRFVYQNAYYSIRNLLTAKNSADLPLRRTARSTRDVPHVYSGPQDFPLGAGVMHFNISGYASDRISAGIIYEVSNPIDSFREKAGLRLVDLPPGLWAVTPLSWVVDRFVDISGALRGLRVLSDPNVTILGGWTSRKRAVQSGVTLIGCTWPGFVNTVSQDTFTTEFRYSERMRWTPSLNDVQPKLDLGSWKQELNMARKDFTSIMDLSALAVKKISSLAKAVK